MPRCVSSRTGGTALASSTSSSGRAWTVRHLQLTSAPSRRLWEGKGITTERFVSGGVDPLTGVRGGGGPVNTIGFNAYPQRYSVTGVSTCSDGDVAELRQAE